PQVLVHGVLRRSRRALGVLQSAGGRARAVLPGWAGDPRGCDQELPRSRLHARRRLLLELAHAAHATGKPHVVPRGRRRPALRANPHGPRAQARSRRCLEGRGAACLAGPASPLSSLSEGRAEGILTLEVSSCPTPGIHAWSTAFNGAR